MEYPNFLNSFGDNIFVLLSREAKILQVSKNWEQYSQLESKDYTQSYFRNYIHPNQKQNFSNWWNMLLANKKITEIDLSIQSGKWQARYTVGALIQKEEILLVLKDTQYTEQLELKLSNKLLHQNSEPSSIYSQLHEIQEDFIHEKHSLDVYKKIGDLAKEVTYSEIFLFAEYKNENLSPVLIPETLKRRDQQTVIIKSNKQLLNTFFFKSLNSGEIHIENNLKTHDNKAGLESDINNYISLPIYHGNNLLGFVALLNSQNGYDALTLEKLLPITTTLGQLLYAYSNKEREETLVEAISEYKAGLEALYEIILTTEESFHGQIEEALELGSKYLKQDNAMICAPAEENFEIVHFFGKDEKKLTSRAFDANPFLLEKIESKVKVFEFDTKKDNEFFDITKKYLVGTSIQMNSKHQGFLAFYSTNDNYTAINSYQAHFLELLGYWLSQKIRENRTNKLMHDQNLALNNSAIVCIMDNQGTIINSNQIYNKLSGFTEEELIGTNISEYFSKDTENTKSSIFEQLRNGNMWQGEIKLTTKIGSHYWSNITIVPFLTDEGKPYQHLAIGFNITDRKVKERMLKASKERAERAMHARSIFPSNMSHEIRTPLNAILGVVDLFDEENLVGNPKKYLKVLKGASKNLAYLIDDILDFSKIDNDKWKINNEWIDISTIFDNLKICLILI